MIYAPGSMRFFLLSASKFKLALFNFHTAVRMKIDNMVNAFIACVAGTDQTTFLSHRPRVGPVHVSAENERGSSVAQPVPGNFWIRFDIVAFNMVELDLVGVVMGDENLVLNFGFTVKEFARGIDILLLKLAGGPITHVQNDAAPNGIQASKRDVRGQPLSEWNLVA